MGEEEEIYRAGGLMNEGTVLEWIRHHLIRRPRIEQGIGWSLVAQINAEEKQKRQATKGLSRKEGD